MKKKFKKKFKQKKRKSKKKIKKAKKRAKHRRRISRRLKKRRVIKKFKNKTQFKLPSLVKEKIKIPKFNLQRKKISFQRILGYLLEPFFRAYEDFREKRKLDKLRKIAYEKKEKERLIKEERRL